jgi:hypothetical protein
MNPVISALLKIYANRLKYVEINTPEFKAMVKIKNKFMAMYLDKIRLLCSISDVENYQNEHDALINEIDEIEQVLIASLRELIDSI